MPSVEKQIQENFDALKGTFEEFKKTNDDRLKLIEKTGHAPADLEEKVDRIITKGLEKYEDRIKVLETAKNREVTETDPATTQSEAKAAVQAFMRKGIATKALSVGSDPDGGYYVRPEFMDSAFVKQFESSPMRQLASVLTISTDRLVLTGSFGAPTASWAGELDSVSATTTQVLKQIEIPVHELRAMPTASQQLLDDASIDVEAWHAAEVVPVLARKEATGFVAGTGVQQPKGITTYTSGDGFNLIEQVNSGAAATLTADGLIDLQMALFETYQPGAAWMMARATMGAARKLKDGQGRYLLDFGINSAMQPLLLGKPVYLASDMPALQASALSVAYGDFRRGYQIVDRVGIRVLRDPYSSKPNVLFYTTKRVGGAVKEFQAIKLGKCSV